MGFRLDDVIQLEVTEIASIPSLFYPMSFKSSLGSVPPYQDDASYHGSTRNYRNMLHARKHNIKQ